MNKELVKEISTLLAIFEAVVSAIMMFVCMFTCNESNYDAAYIEMFKCVMCLVGTVVVLVITGTEED